jgi:hypothetical protein
MILLSIENLFFTVAMMMWQKSPEVHMGNIVLHPTKEVSAYRLADLWGLEKRLCEVYEEGIEYGEGDLHLHPQTNNQYLDLRYYGMRYQEN